MDRRQVLGTVGSGVAVMLAGCSGFGTGGDGTPGDGKWVLSGSIENASQSGSDWLVECASTDRDSAVSVSGTLPAGETHAWELSGGLVDETREIGVRVDRGATSRTWVPTECPRLTADVTIGDAGPTLETQCRSE